MKLTQELRIPLLFSQVLAADPQNRRRTIRDNTIDPQLHTGQLYHQKEPHYQLEDRLEAKKKSTLWSRYFLVLLVFRVNTKGTVVMFGVPETGLLECTLGRPEQEGGKERKTARDIRRRVDI